MSKEMWNQRYAESVYVYGTTPNDFYKKELDKLTPGKILLPAEGEGRNAVYAAELGWRVCAFDQSEEGKKKALRFAKERNVSIEYMIKDLDHIDYPADQFDAIGLVFVHLPGAGRRAIHRNIIRYLKPGGTLILVGFSKEQLPFNSGGPKDLAWLFSKEELIEDFIDLQIISLTQMETMIEEGEFHNGPASVIQLVAKKQVNLRYKTRSGQIRFAKLPG